MLTITISPRALLIATLLILAALTAFVAHDAFAGDPDEQIQGDVNCDDGVDSDDILDHLYYAAAFEPLQNEPCTDIGDSFPVGGGEPGPPRPPGPPGINLFADVTAEGNLINGTATSANRLFEGVYTVTFATDVSDCTGVANTGLSGSGGGSFHQLGIASTSIGTLEQGPSEVRVQINRPIDPYQFPYNDFVDSAFHLIVVC